MLEFGGAVVTGPVAVARFLARQAGFGGGDAADEIFDMVQSFYESKGDSRVTQKFPQRVPAWLKNRVGALI